MSSIFRPQVGRRFTALGVPALRLLAGIAIFTLAAAPGFAQQSTSPEATPSPAPAPTPAPTPSTRPAPAPPGDAQQLDRVEIRGGRETDTQQRQRSTASKIIVGREEIERYGDSTVGELLRRLPGVTQQGAPGRGGRIAMRGMGSYTQILLDGQRMPPGFSLESLNPDQIERIEILRAPTAETGARAIAGTINIITREGFVRRLNDLVATIGVENDRWQPGLSWTRNDAVDRLTYNLSASINRFGARNDDLATTVVDDPTTGNVRELRRESGQATSTTDRTTASGRLQWRLDNGSLMLAPFLLDVRTDSRSASRLDQLVGSTPPLYATAQGERESAFSLARLNTLWRHRFADGASLESRLNYGEGRSRADSLRREFDGAGSLSRTFDDDSRARQRGGDLGSKLSFSLGDGHALVAGVEGESSERRDSRRTLQDGVPQATDFGDNLQARSTRLAAYAQDEWSINPNFAAHAGLRWEGIATRGGGDTRTETNRSSVWSPLLHGVWKPQADGRDQVRMSLTRSYRSPQLNDLIARPSISARYPASGSNTPTSPDFAGNPALRPELATGIDLAAERYLVGGGLFSANLFVRRIEDLMRTVTTLETVSWSAQPRWVARPQNVGDATTTGLELEAKFRLAEFWAEAPRVDVRANASAFRSRVSGIPGPDNRLDEQPDFTFNLGADYRPRGTPLMLGASVNYTPGYDTQRSTTQFSRVSRKSVIDAYAQWTVSPSLRLRLTASNLVPLDYATERALVADAAARETTRSEGSTHIAWRLRAEFKL